MEKHPAAVWSSRRWLVVLAAGSMVSSATLGCDTVAEISFDERNFFNVLSLGSAHPGMCEEDDSNADIRFILRDQRARVIRFNDRLEDVPVVNEEALPVTNIEFSESKLYSVTPPVLVRCPSETERIALGIDEQDPDGIASCLSVGGDRCVAFNTELDDIGITWDGGSDVHFCRRSCSSDADCSGGTCATDGEGLQYCTFNISTGDCNGADDCPNGFLCEPISGDASRSLCVLDTTIIPTPGSVELVTPDPSNGEADWAVSIVMDNSGSLVGEGVSEDDSSVVLARATDRGGFRISSMQQFVNLLNDTESRPWGENMALGLWSFRGETSAGVQPETGELATGNTPANPYTFNRQVITQALTELRRQAEFGRSNVFTALQVVAENFRDLPGTANRERAIILFTDGPDDSEVVFIEASDEDRQRAKDARQQKLEDAISILQEQQIQVFVVHLDTAIGPEGVAAVQADPFNAQPYPRDGDGRFGPLDEYARIACATNGQYVYVPNPERLNRVMELLVDQFGGTWGVNVGIESLEQTQLENAPYQLGTIMQVTLGDEGRYFFSPLGNTSSAIGSSDNRPAVFKRQGGAPRENTNLGGTLNNTTINLPSGTP